VKQFGTPVVLRTPPIVETLSASLDKGAPLLPPSGIGAPERGRSITNGHSERRAGPRGGAIRRVVSISPSAAVERRTVSGGVITAEIVHAKGQDRIEFRYRAASDLLVVYDQGERRDGETFIEGAPKSTLRNFARRLSFVPAGHAYFEWHQLRAPARIMFVYLDTPEYDGQSPQSGAKQRVSARAFFEDSMLWSTVLKLKGLVESPLSPFPADSAYFEALGSVLVQEVARMQSGESRVGAKGGLAAWQQRIVAAYIEEHVTEQVPLARLAQLARLSPYHFSRAFKQSFGVPPHRYHTGQRIERAKALLEDRALSVTDIGLALGFRETSSFTAAFRKATGLTPSRYHRSIS
jgi:AraC family transcriptional regulator